MDRRRQARRNEISGSARRLRRTQARLPARVAPWARSVIVCAINYNTAHPYSIDLQKDTENARRGWISRYAWAKEDYHDAVLRRLRKVEEDVQEAVARTEDRELGTENCLFRSYVDTGPLVERIYAKYAGIGWIGKNTCIINQQLGSWLFLGVILTSLGIEERITEEITESLTGETGPDENALRADSPAPDRCGTCTRCITACPTQAITAPGELDARLCISYLTIEKRGEISGRPPPSHGPPRLRLRHLPGRLPWNRKAPITSAHEFEPREGLVNPALDWLAEMKQEEFSKTFRGSPIKRAKLSGLRRNAVIAMGNSGDQKFAPTLTKLAEDEDAVVAEHAKWAMHQLK